MGCVSSRDNDYAAASTSSNGYNSHQKEASVVGTSGNRQKSKKKMFSKSSNVPSCLSNEKNGSLRLGNDRDQTDDQSFLSITEQLDSSENFQTPKKRAKFRKKKLEDDVAKIKKRTKKTKNSCFSKQRSSSGDNATENGDVEKEDNSKKTKRKKQQNNSKLRANNTTTANAQRGNISQDDKVGSKLAYANGDPTASPTINNNNVGNNKINQLNENGNGNLISKNNHHAHCDIDDVHSASFSTNSNFSGLSSSAGCSSTSSSVPAEILLKNFQDRLSTAQSKNTKLTDSQLEFFRLLDEKIERGQDYQPS